MAQPEAAVYLPDETILQNATYFIKHTEFKTKEEIAEEVSDGALLYISSASLKNCKIGWHLCQCKQVLSHSKKNLHILGIESIQEDKLLDLQRHSWYLCTKNIKTKTRKSKAIICYRGQRDKPSKYKKTTTELKKKRNYYKNKNNNNNKNKTTSKSLKRKALSSDDENNNNKKRKTTTITATGTTTSTCSSSSYSSTLTSTTNKKDENIQNLYGNDSNNKGTKKHNKTYKDYLHLYQGKERLAKLHLECMNIFKQQLIEKCINDEYARIMGMRTTSNCSSSCLSSSPSPQNKK